MKFAPQEVRTYFVTAVCAERRRIFQTTANASLMLEVIQTNRTKNRMQIHAFVLMPDHMHLLLTPAPNVSLEMAVRFLLGGYSFLLKSKMGVWERSYPERRVLDANGFLDAKQYIERILSKGGWWRLRKSSNIPLQQESTSSIRHRRGSGAKAPSFPPRFRGLKAPAFSG